MASERRPEGVEGYALDVGLFPFDAFTSTKPTVAQPVVGMAEGWKLLTDTAIATAGLADADELYVYDKDQSVYRKVTLLSLASAIGTILGV